MVRITQHGLPLTNYTMPMTCLMLCPLQAIQKVKRMVDFSGKHKKLWNEWEIRFLVVFSLLLQIFLIFSGPLRRRKTAKWIRPFIWVAYLLADWVAAFTLGILSDSVHGSPECKGSHCINRISSSELVAFWAPFLLMHLGGPDTITALALEDNQLWLRHLLALIIHLIGAIYVFVLTLPNNRILIPTLIIFMVGIVRYIERTRALYLASSGGFSKMAKTPKEATGGVDSYEPHEIIRIDEHHSAKTPKSIDNIEAVTSAGGVDSYEPDEIIRIDEHQSAKTPKSIDNIEAVTSAHRFLATYKCLIVDHLLNYEDPTESRSYFLDLRPEDAFGIIDIELGLLFDMLYTKAMVNHNHVGYISRAVCFSSILAALAIFIPFDKRGSHRVDKFITYALLIGATVLEVIAIANLIFSNWMVNTLRNGMARRLPYKLCARDRFYWSPRLPAYMSQYNLISYCLRNYWTPIKIVKLRVSGNFIEQLAFTQDKLVSTQLKMLIFDNLLNKSKRVIRSDNVNGISEYRWSWTRKHAKEVPPWVFNLELEESIMLWHIVTDICYYLEVPKFKCENTKLLSDYMHYLLVMHPTMISSTEGIPKIKWRQLCENVTDFIRKFNLKNKMELFQKMLEVYRSAVTFEPHERPPRPLQIDACLIAQKLVHLPEIWDFINEVWCELLHSAANRCSGKEHAQRLVKGGEFLTSVWLLSHHLGLGQEYNAEFQNSPQIKNSSGQHQRNRW